MFFKNLKKQISLLLLLFIIPINVLAYSDYLIPGGKNIGIKLNSDGILVIGTYLNTDLKKGDRIISIDNKDVNNIDEFNKFINNKDSFKVSYIRNDKKYDTTIKKNNNKTGLYLKDSIVGIGTITFIDPKTGLFGALGHEIIESSTGSILKSKSGSIFDSNVTSVDSSRAGSPGEVNANFNSNNIKGFINENTTQGIFGEYKDIPKGSTLYEVAKKDDISIGDATIRTVISGNEIKEYSINITSIDLSKKNKNYVFEITDENLLNKTGGVIQGMSGSPIFQNNKIIGAVTHVVVNNPSKGYGIFIENMLKEAEN